MRFFGFGNFFFDMFNMMNRGFNRFMGNYIILQLSLFIIMMFKVCIVCICFNINIVYVYVLIYDFIGLILNFVGFMGFGFMGS